MRLLDLMGSVTEFLGLAVVCLQVLLQALKKFHGRRHPAPARCEP